VEARVIHTSRVALELLDQLASARRSCSCSAAAITTSTTPTRSRRRTLSIVVRGASRISPAVVHERRQARLPTTYESAHACIVDARNAIGAASRNEERIGRSRFCCYAPVVGILVCRGIRVVCAHDRQLSAFCHQLQWQYCGIRTLGSNVARATDRVVDIL